MKEMSVCLSQLEKRFEMFILDEWATFQPVILQSLSTVAFAGRACLRLHAAYWPPSSSLAARLDVVCAELQELRVSPDSPFSSGGPPSSVPSLISTSSSSSQSSSPLHIQIHPGRWCRLSPVRLDGGQVFEEPLQQEEQGHQAEVYSSGPEEGVMVSHRQLLWGGAAGAWCMGDPGSL
jgi:hypothetical protein